MGAYQLKNEELTLTVISAGAEMKSLKDNKTEQEYLWQADPKFWGRTSPVLFPIVGNYAQKQSVYEGKTYTLSQHGFARDMEFDLESQTEEEIWFVLKDTESTLEKYPFHSCNVWFCIDRHDNHVLSAVRTSVLHPMPGYRYEDDQ